MSVARLCEELDKVKSLKLKGDGLEYLNDSIAITVYTTLANGKEELAYKNGAVKIVDGVEVHYFKRMTKDHSHLSPALLAYTWKTIQNFDLVHIHAWWNLVSVGVSLIAWLKGVKVLITPRGTLSTYSFETNTTRPKKIFHRLIGKRLLNRSFFHCTSVQESNEVKKIIQPPSIYVIPNFVELPETPFFWKSKVKKDLINPLKLVFLSRVEKKKGLEILFETLSDIQLEWQLNIVGSGESSYLESLKKETINFHINEQIKWLGHVSGDEKFHLLAQADFLILPSYNENFANVVIESLYCGTPVIISDQVGLSDYVSLFNLGVVHQRSSEGLKNAIIYANKNLVAGAFEPEILYKQITADYKNSILLNKYLVCYQTINDNV